MMIAGKLNTLLYCLPPFTPTSRTTLDQCFSNWCSTETPGENGHWFLSSSNASSSYWLCLPKQGSPSLNALQFLSGANNIHSWNSKSWALYLPWWQGPDYHLRCTFWVAWNHLCDFIPTLPHILPTSVIFKQRSTRLDKEQKLTLQPSLGL